MVLQAEWGDWRDEDRGTISMEPFLWRGRIRLAVYRVHPSGRELVCVMSTGYRAGQALPKR